MRLTRSDVDHKVAPLLGGNVGEAPLHQRLAGGDELHDGGVSGLQVALDALDQRRRLHGGQQVVVEALLRALERGARGRLGLGVERARAAPAAGAGDVRRLQCRGQVVVDHLEGAGVGVVDAPLLGRERVLDELVLDALVGERPRGVEAEALEVAGQHLHGRHAAGLDGLHELGPRGEGEIRAAPQARGAGHRRGCAPSWRRSPRRRRRAHRAARAAGAGRRGPAARAPPRRARSCRRPRSAWRGSRRTRSRRRSWARSPSRARGRARRGSGRGGKPCPRARPSAAWRR